MKLIITILVLFVCHGICSQDRPANNTFSRISVGKTYVDTMSFHKNWDYPWYIVTNENGQPVENTIGESITASDTIHLYYSADCQTDHQGLYTVRYCEASSHTGLILLKFGPELPAYAGELSVFIKGDQFRCEFTAVYPAPTQDLSWQITSQKLMLEKAAYGTGESIKGHIRVEFTESGKDAKGKPFSDKYYFRGYFKTLLIK